MQWTPGQSKIAGSQTSKERTQTELDVYNKSQRIQVNKDSLLKMAGFV